MADQEDKTYYPETIPDQPFPGEEEVSGGTGIGAGETFSPSTIGEKVIAKAKVARQLISESLDTLARRIIGVFTFAETGAIQIGKHEQGESGDIRISPNGIVARDQSGETTFALDGSTGNATFKGTVQAGSFLAGDSNIVMETSQGKGRIVIDDTILLGWEDE